MSEREKELHNILYGTEHSSNLGFDNNRQKELHNILYGEPEHVSNKKQSSKGFWETQGKSNEFLKNKMASGLLALADLPQAVIPTASSRTSDIIAQTHGKPTEPKIHPSEKIRSWLQKNGYLSENTEPQGWIDRYGGNALEWMAPTAAMGPFAGAAPTALAGAMGTASQGLQEVGIPRTYADLATIAGVPAGSAGTARLLKNRTPSNKSTISHPEEHVSNYLKNLIGKENVPEVIKNIKHGEHIPLPEQYKPMLAEMAFNPEVSKLHQYTKGLTTPEGKALSEAEMIQNELLSRELQNLAPNVPEEYASNFLKERKERFEGASKKRLERREEKLSSELPHYESGATRTSGELTQNELISLIKEAKKNRYEQTHHLYEEFKLNPTRTDRKHTESFINQELPFLRGKNEQHLKKTREHLNTRQPPVNQEMADEAISQLTEHYPNVITAIKNISEHPTIGEMMGVRQNVQKTLESAEQYGQSSTAYFMRKLKDEIDLDISKASPQAGKELNDINNLYRELSGPINFIESHRALGPDIKQYYRSKEFVKGPLEITSKYINGPQSEKNARDLLHAIGNKPDVLNKLRSNVHNVFLDYVTDSNGKINHSKLRNFIDTHPGSAIIDPNLNTRVKNIQNAQKIVNEARKSYETHIENYTTGVTSELLNENINKVVNKIFTSKNPLSEMRNVKKQLDKDNTGAAMDGFKRLLINDLMDKTKTMGQGASRISYPKFLNQYEKNKKTYAEIFNPEQMYIMDTILNSLKSRNIAETLGSGINSSTIPKMTLQSQKSQEPSMAQKMVNEGADILAHHFGVLGYFAKRPFLLAADKKRKMFDEQALTVLGNAMSDANYAKYLLSNDKKQKSSLLKKLKEQYKNGVYIGSLHQFSQQE